jgi:hypothetical protein
LGFSTSQASSPYGLPSNLLPYWVPLSLLLTSPLTEKSQMNLRVFRSVDSRFSPEGVLACWAFLTDVLPYLLGTQKNADYFFLSDPLGFLRPHPDLLCIPLRPA